MDHDLDLEIGIPVATSVAGGGDVTGGLLPATPEGQVWGCRLEIYGTDPAERPDPNDWETDLAFRLAD